MSEPANQCGIVIVSYNSARHIERLLDSIPAAAEELRIRCVVVDNGSNDETVSVLRSRSDVTIVETGRNLGYAAAINVGRKVMGSTFPLMVLNPDLVLEVGAIAQLYRAFDDPKVGVALPMLLDNDGNIDPSLRREPTTSRALGDALFGHRIPWRPGWLSETVWDRRAYGEQHDVVWGGGAAMLISQSCNYLVGDWDESFFLYSEETDFAARVRKKGYRIRYVPDSRIRHEGGGSGGSLALEALKAVNRVRYYEKYHHRPATSAFRAMVALHYLLRCGDRRNRVTLKAVLRRSAWTELTGVRARQSSLRLTKSTSDAHQAG
jgi:GT2 family glycosyltransferase